LRSSAAAKSDFARAPSLLPPAAWNSSACVSVTADAGSRTIALRGLDCLRSPSLARRLVRHSRFMNGQRPEKRGFHFLANVGVGLQQTGIIRRDVDRPDPGTL